jgi:hypothetical protein
VAISLGYIQRKKVGQPNPPVAVPAKPVRKSSSSLRRREQIPGKLKRTTSASLAAKKEHLRGDAKSKSDKKEPKRPWSFVFAGNVRVVHQSRAAIRPLISFIDSSNPQ